MATITKSEWLFLVRDFLKDTDQQAFSDKIILYYTAKALKDVARKTHYFRAKAFLPITSSNIDINLPSNHIKTLKLFWNNCIELKLLQSNELCDCDDCSVGTPVYAVNDLTGRKTLKLVPRPSQSLLDEIGVDEYGFLIDIDGSNNNCGRELINDNIDIFGKLNTTGDIYGVVSNIENLTTPLTLYYVYYPILDVNEALISNDDYIVINDDYIEDLILYYVTGHLLRQDKDTVANSIALQQIQLYDKEIQQLRKEVKRRFSRTYYPLKQKNIFNEV